MYEFGKTYWSEEGVYYENQRLALFLTGANEIDNWNNKAKQVSFYNLKSVVDTIIQRLNIKGLVTKRLCATDKRLVDVSLTQEGKKLLTRLDKRNCEMEQIMSNLNKSELETLNALLDKLRSVD